MDHLAAYKLFTEAEISFDQWLRRFIERHGATTSSDPMLLVGVVMAVMGNCGLKMSECPILNIERAMIETFRGAIRGAQTPLDEDGNPPKELLEALKAQGNA